MIGAPRSPSRRRTAAAFALGLLAAATWISTPFPAPVTCPDDSVRVAVRIDCADAELCLRAETLALDVWSEHRGPGVPLDIVVSPSTIASLAAGGVHVEVLVPDIDAVAAAEAQRLHSPVANKPADWYGEFRDFGAISTQLGRIAADHSDRATLVPVGGSIEGRPILALRIGTGNADAMPMLVNGAQHAREWIAAMTTTCVAERLVREYDTDPAIREFVDSTELWIIPVVNPDGYQYSWSGNRYWRKNRRGSHGVDLNRNFSLAWGGSGSSKDKRSEIYRGEHAFSEPETIALRDLVLREHVKLHVDFHAYGQLLLYPWNHTPAPAKDRDKLAAVGDRLASAIYAKHGTRYTLKAGANLYPAAGTMTDWMYGIADALSFTIELRPKGGSGFVLPPDQIRPTCDEGLAAVLELRRAVTE